MKNLFFKASGFIILCYSQFGMFSEDYNPKKLRELLKEKSFIYRDLTINNSHSKNDIINEFNKDIKDKDQILRDGELVGIDLISTLNQYFKINSINIEEQLLR